MSKQTAVEWIYEKLSKSSSDELVGNINLWFQQAKAMEKEQITIAYQSDRILCFDEVAEEYYNETYGGDK
jgi:hypothetical protein